MVCLADIYPTESRGVCQVWALARNLPRRIKPSKAPILCPVKAAMMKEIYQRGPIACGIDAGPLLKLGQVISDIIGFREPPNFQKRHVDLIVLPSLKLTACPWKWMVWRWNVLLGRPIFTGYVSFTDGNSLWIKPCEQLMISVLPRKDLYFVKLRL